MTLLNVFHYSIQFLPRSLKHSLILLAALFANVFVHAGVQQEQIDPVVRTADAQWVGESHLLRSESHLSAIVKTSDLDPGAAVTVWWRIYNRPENCAEPYNCEMLDLSRPSVQGAQLHATAFVVEQSQGTATVVASLYRTARRAQGGEKFEDTLAAGGRGLRRPLHAEVELLFSSHGRAAHPDSEGVAAWREQLLTPTGVRLDCADPSSEQPGRTFRCGILQRVDHRGN